MTRSGYASRPCRIVADSCQAPANGPHSTRGTCFACGEPVCLSGGCSLLRRWFGHGRRRICTDCAEQDDR